MRQMAPTLAAAGPGPAAAPTGESLVVLIDRSARESGLAQALTGSQPAANGAMTVRMENADFNLLIGWMSRLVAQHDLRVEAASITAAAARAWSTPACSCTSADPVRLRYVLLGLLAFVIALLVVLPAAWLKGWLPPQVACGSLGGSVWRGQCSALSVALPGKPPLRLDAVSWQLHALSLLRGRLQADVSLAGADLAASGQITASAGGTLRLEGFTGSGGLDHARLAALPTGWSARAEARDLTLEIAANRITALGGTLLARQLRDARGTAFGDFKIEFPPQADAPFRGMLTDEGGPMQLQSQLVLNADQSWQLRGTVTLRPGSPRDWPAHSTSWPPPTSTAGANSASKAPRSNPARGAASGQLAEFLQHGKYSAARTGCVPAREASVRYSVSCDR